MQDSVPQEFLAPETNRKSSLQSRTLYVVATPIGNMGDITFRGVEVLREADIIAAEDTRHTRLLLDRHGIKTVMVPYHEHNARRILPELIKKLKDGATIAQVSDAGTPGVSDPGYRLIHEAIEEGIDIVPVPGASAALAALVASGLPMDRFTFEGFLPRKKGRSTRLEELVSETRTMIFYESPNRLVRTLEDFAETFGNERKAVVGRELTKKFEDFQRGTLEEQIEEWTSREPKGEITIVVEGAGRQYQKRVEASEEQENALPFNLPPLPGQENNVNNGFNFPDMKKRRRR